MKSMFQMCFYICLLLVLVNLGWGFLRGMDDLWTASASDQNVLDENTDQGLIHELTGLDSGGTDLWLMITTVGGAAALAFSWMVHSLTPLGLYLFGVAFWTSYNGTMTIINMNSWLPGDFILIVTVVMAFLFIGAIIGMITGSG